MALRILNFGGGKERQSKQTPEQFEERKRVALGWHVEPEDPIKQKLLFIAGETGRVPDDMVASEIDSVFKDRTLEERGALVIKVNEIRHPKKTGAGNENQPLS